MSQLENREQLAHLEQVLDDQLEFSFEVAKSVARRYCTRCHATMNGLHCPECDWDISTIGICE